MLWDYSFLAKIFPVKKPIMPPPKAAAIPSFRPVNAIAGVPRAVATKRAAHIGT